MKKIFLAFILLLAANSLLMADGVLKVKNENNSYLLPVKVEVRTEIVNQVAITTTKQTFRNTTGKNLLLQYGFPTDVNASVTDFSWWQNGKKRTAKMNGHSQDTLIDNPGSGGTKDQVLADYLGQTPFIFTFQDQFEKDSDIVVELTYIEFLRYGLGRVQYTYPIKKFNQENFAFSLDFSLRSLRKLNQIESVTHTINFTATDTTATALYTANTVTNKNLLITYQLDQTDLGAFLLSTKPNGEDGFFLMLAEPDPKTSQEKVIDKIFSFIIDVSGSMAGIKMEQAKEAAKYCILHLNQEDKFNIIAFSDAPKQFKAQPVSVTTENIDAGVNYITKLNAGGGTNLQDALLRGLIQDMPDTTANIIVFLTDGQASLDQQTIINANKKNVRIFVFGIGSDVNKDLLSELASKNNGLSEFLGNNDVTDGISNFYNKIQNPLLLNPTIEFSSGEVYDASPRRLPDIYVGEQLTLLGRYKVPGASTSTIRGTAYAGPAEYTYPVTFVDDSLVNVFIPKMWAKSRITDLLDLMKSVQENSNSWKEWKAEIIRLSLKYGIMSPFSSFSDPGDGTGDPTWVFEEPEQSINDKFVVSPNPFSNETKITLELPEFLAQQNLTIKLYDQAGAFIAEIFRGETFGGIVNLQWNGKNMLGENLANGTYICRAEIDGKIYVCRIVLMR
ncbi:MAG: VWA domain-containing protein [Bacteroidota bacterium]